MAFSLVFFVGIILIVVLFVGFLALGIRSRSSYAGGEKDKYPYIRAKLLTDGEAPLYDALKSIAGSLNYAVFPKVRVADLVNVQNGLTGGQRQRYNDRIQSRRAGFVLYDAGANEVRLVVELDDGKRRDEFIDRTLAAAGIPLLRVSSTDGLEEKVRMSLGLTR